jgi:predicted transcriptional regulator
MTNPQRKRPSLIAFSADDEMIDRLKRLAAQMGVTVSDIARSALSEKLNSLEKAIERGERFEVRRPLGVISPVAG